MEGKNHIDQLIKNRVNSHEPVFKEEYWKGFEQMLPAVPPASAPISPSGIGKVMQLLSSVKGIVSIVAVATLSTSTYFIADAILERERLDQGEVATLAVRDSLSGQSPDPREGFLAHEQATADKLVATASPFSRDDQPGTAHAAIVTLDVINQAFPGNGPIAFAPKGNSERHATATVGKNPSFSAGSQPVDAGGSKAPSPGQVAALLDIPLLAVGQEPWKKEVTEDEPIPSREPYLIDNQLEDPRQAAIPASNPGDTSDSLSVVYSDLPEQLDTLSLQEVPEQVPRPEGLGPKGQAGDSPFSFFLSPGITLYHSLGNTPGFSPKQKLAFHFGAGLVAKINSQFRLLAEAGFLRTAGNELEYATLETDYLFYPWITDTRVENREFTFLQLPVILQYTYERHSLGAGPVFSCLLASSGEKTFRDTSKLVDTYTHEKAVNYMDGLARWQYGLGLEYAWCFYRQHAILISHNLFLNNFIDENIYKDAGKRVSNTSRVSIRFRIY